MSALIIANLLRSKFLTDITDATTGIGLRTVWDNEIKEASGWPASGQWCRHFVQFGESRQISFGGPGSRRFRTEGQVLVHLFEPIGEGDAAQLNIVDAVQAAYRGQTLVSGQVFVDFDGPGVIAGSQVVDDKWWLLALAIDFRADEVSQ